MRDFILRPEVRPELFQLAGPTNGKSFARSRPRGPFSDAEERELAGKAATAAASAPTRANPIAAAPKTLADSANEKPARKAARAPQAGKIAEGAVGAAPKKAEDTSAAAAMKPAAAADRIATQISRTRTHVPGGCVCTICEPLPGVCECRKAGQSGCWFRSRSSMIVNC
jgi:hypothetical protein